MFDGRKLGIEPQAVHITPDVFDSSKLGMRPYAVEITPAGDLVLESSNNNIYRVQVPLSPCEHALPPTSPYPFQFFQVLASCHRNVGHDDMSSTITIFMLQCTRLLVRMIQIPVNTN